jgi:hypothetical protein
MRGLALNGGPTLVEGCFDSLIGQAGKGVHQTHPSSCRIVMENRLDAGWWLGLVPWTVDESVRIPCACV